MFRTCFGHHCHLQQFILQESTFISFTNVIPILGTYTSQIEIIFWSLAHDLFICPLYSMLALAHGWTKPPSKTTEILHLLRISKLLHLGLCLQFHICSYVGQQSAMDFADKLSIYIKLIQTIHILVALKKVDSMRWIRN